MGNLKIFHLPAIILASLSKPDMLVPEIEGALGSNNAYSSHWISIARAVQCKAQFQAVSLLGQSAQSVWS